MNITFFIGNGFDLNLGLHTRYEHFYPYFLQNANKNNLIRNWIDEKESLWSNLEEKLGQELSVLKQNQQEAFYDDKDELDSLLLEYLEQEQNKYNFEEDKEKVIKEMQRSLLNFTNGLSGADKNSIQTTLMTYGRNSYKYEFISFNYTIILDRIVEAVKQKNKVIGTHLNNGTTLNNVMGDVLHIHGTLDEEMILGVNDIDQIHNNFLKLDNDFHDTFIKIRMNNAIGQGKTEKAKTIIDNSHIICIFGTSIGNTDKYWWEAIVKWLFSNDKNKVIIYVFGYKEKIKKKLPSVVIRLKKKIIKDFCIKGQADYKEEDFEKIKNQIFVVFNEEMFAFPKVNEKFKDMKIS